MALYNGPIDFAHTSRQGGSILAQTVEKVQSRRAEAFLEGDSKLAPSEENTIRVFRENTPSVVNINTFTNAQSFTMDVDRIPQGQGSGIVWDDSGHIVTNFHVVQGAVAASVTVTEAGGKQTVYKAKLVGTDPDKDVAVLKIDAKIRPVSLAKSSSLQVGQTVYAIGNPFALDHSLTKGIISGLGRETQSPTGRTITNVVQTDAAINPGNSGGALLDSSGNLIGMNTAILSASGGSAGIGFAIPSDTMSVVVDRIIAGDQVQRPVIGITFLESQQTFKASGVRGVLVLDVPRGSPAERAGIKPTVRSFNGVELGDIIVGINGAKVSGEADLFANVEKYKPGETITVTVLRSAGEQDGRAKFNQLDFRVQLGVAQVKNAPRF